jgi:hypothetical protein
MLESVVPSRHQRSLLQSSAFYKSLVQRSVMDGFPMEQGMAHGRTHWFRPNHGQPGSYRFPLSDWYLETPIATALFVRFGISGYAYRH